jgi:hypothetical protein
MLHMTSIFIFIYYDTNSDFIHEYSLHKMNIRIFMNIHYTKWIFGFTNKKIFLLTLSTKKCAISNIWKKTSIVEQKCSNNFGLTNKVNLNNYEKLFRHFDL